MRSSVKAGVGAAVMIGVGLAVLAGTSHDGAGPLPSAPEVDAYCADAQTLGRLPSLAPGGDAEGMARQFSAVRTAMAHLAATAPPEIRTDLGLFVRTYTAILDAAADAGYDMTKVPAATVDALDAPPVRTALQRVSAFDRRHCGT